MELDYFLIRLFLLWFATNYCNAGYSGSSYGSAEESVKSEVPAPVYGSRYVSRQGSRSNLYTRKSSFTSSSGTKTSYGGTKTSYGGTKTSYGGTKTSYGGTKTSYGGTKSAYGSGIKTSSGGSHSYTGSKTWESERGTAPNYESFHEGANEVYSPKCTPGCQNNGICVDTNTCHCPADYHGQYCEFHKIPCLTYPPLPMNSKRQCTADLCTITCAAGHRFLDGSTVASLKCAEGHWVPTRADLSSIPDCDPDCTPPCLNGGVCLSVNTCQCPQEYRGPQCQYAATACDIRKLSFNGAYKCRGDDERFTCTLGCPAGVAASSNFAEAYTCLYSTGTFEPQPIPRCLFNAVGGTSSSYKISGYNESHYESHYENRSNTYGSYNQVSSTDVAYGASSAGKGWRRPVTVVVQEMKPKPGTCLTWAGTHYKTFDGVVYSFQSPCQHTLVRDAKEHKFSVSVKQPRCKRHIYCPLEITLFLEDKEYVLGAGGEGEVVFRSSSRALPVPAALPGLRLALAGGHVMAHLDGVGLSIDWDTDSFIAVEASSQLWNNTEGLCGRLDGNPDTDVLKKDGEPAVTKSSFAASWQVKKIDETCESSPTETSACSTHSDDRLKDARHFCTKIFSSSKFRKCSAAMDVSLLLEACEWDYCGCVTSNPSDAEECACRTVAVYAGECLRRGVHDMRLWRDADTCPMNCPEGKVYMACGPSSQPSCAFPDLPAKVENSTCVEGCFCPSGLLLEGGRCVPPARCPCRLRNRTFKPGDSVVKDCNTCTCESGSWTCTRVPCGARCGAVGDPHYVTFDGTRYDFMGHCTYYLTKMEGLVVEVENVACSGAISEAMNLAPSTYAGKPSCTKAVTIKYGLSTMHLKQGGFILVDGVEVTKLPMQLSNGALIRAASSLFIIVQLPNSVDVWWDGNTRVFVDVPPEMNNKTMGLCGTFNLNQKDDFLTPEGDTEHSVHAFANKWKTAEVCTDLDVKEPEHPCKTNVQNKETAEKLCKKLKSDLFEACHWHVDVTPYYESCVYDMCACDGDISRCLCPTLGDYAMACAAKGVKIQWRYSVKECELSCPGGQEYTVCADSCQRSCSDVALRDLRVCKPSCVEGCACPVGQMLDDSGSCVPQGLCPCYYKGRKFNPGYKEVRPGRREIELCTCTGGGWSCTAASPADLTEYPAADEAAARCRASDKKEYAACADQQITCKNMHLPPSPPTGECRGGCRCMAGFVLDSGSDSCVPRASCPCHHAGQSYPDGHTMQQDCNTCTCKSGNWSCTNRRCAGICTSWGDSHVVTFDGRDYDFEGVCSYLLAKGCLEKGNDEFQVEIQNVPCGTTGATCSKSVTLKAGRAGGEESVTLSEHTPLPDQNTLKRIKIRPVGSFIFLDVPSLGMSLQWDRATRVYVKLDPMWQNRVKGLCGNYNGDMRDDFQTPSSGGTAESSPLIFAESWKLRATCPKAQEVQDHCKQRPSRKEWAVNICGRLKEYPFTLCHTEVPPSSYISRCEGDACACDAGEDCRCACAALAAYAQLCADRAVYFKWRTNDLCPMQCDEECSNYESCIDACPPETCDNMLQYEEVKISCSRDTCVEGCKPKKSCPPGEVYTNSTYTSCVPRNLCRVPCTSRDGSPLLDGDVTEQDACHTCTCSAGHVVCTGQPCAVTETPTLSPIPTTTTSTPTPKPHDEPLKCISGWSPWVSRTTPEIDAKGESVEAEPLPREVELEPGKPMCKPEMMSQIECRTVTDHKTAKETGLNVECSLEKGLLCVEAENTCPDFEVRVLCQCEDGFQCLDASHPSHPHPHNCRQFYECTPDLLNPSKPHTVLKSCDQGLMYNPVAMVCDWPAAVIALRPECRNDTLEVLHTQTAAPLSTATWATVTTPSPRTESPCPAGQEYSKCAYRCDKMCHHFKHEMISQGKCEPGQKCIEGCVDTSVLNIKCEIGSLWRDARTCVPLHDCTCATDSGDIVKPGGTHTDGCIKCQCLDNDLHCDTSHCETAGPTHQPYIVTVPTVRTTEPTARTSEPTARTTEPTASTPTPSTTTAAPSTTLDIIITKSIVTPPPQCDESRFKDLLWNNDTPPGTVYTASSVESPMYEPQYAILNGQPVNNPDTFQCLDATHPSHQHPHNCRQFYECTPDLLNPTKPHTVLKSCDEGLMYNPVAMVCDWPAAVIALRPECRNGSDLLQTQKPSTATSVTGGCWMPSIQDTNQYMEVRFPAATPVWGVRLQGGPERQQYVTSYGVLYAVTDGVFHHVAAADGTPQVFKGPSDHDTASTQLFYAPIEAKVVRIRPLSWHDAIAVRIQLIGCGEPSTTTTVATTPAPPPCLDDIGLQAGLPVDNIEVSSNPELRDQLAMNSALPWKPMYSTPGEWVMFDFGSPRKITGIKSKGGPNGHVTAFHILYTSDLSVFNPMVDKDKATLLFPGNYDGDSVVFTQFERPIHARYLKYLPVKWKGAVEVRLEPIGCYLPYPATQSTSTKVQSMTTTTSSPCRLCAGAQAPLSGECDCTGTDMMYDGENCVSRDQCPCFVGFMSYPVGASFRGVKCDECVCKLGGRAHCRPADLCKCDPNFVPKQSNTTCECSCEPCPTGTRICPTSGLCLPLAAWCDGTEDCPDDEVDCSTTVPPSTTLEPTVGTTRVGTLAAVVTTPRPEVQCPKVDCPPGYHVVYTAVSPRDVPRRTAYARYYTRGGRLYTKGGSTKGGSSKGGTKSFTKTVYSSPPTPQTNEAFALTKPSTSPSPKLPSNAPCRQFKCVPKLPSLVPGTKPAPLVCDAPKCPEKYTLKMETLKTGCPQYTCLPPPEKPVYCELAGRTFTTFDGAQYKYDICFHILARENRLDAWTVLVRKKCRVEGCVNQLLVRQDDQLILVKPNLMIEYDNYEYTVEQTNMICFRKNSFDLSRVGSGLLISSRKYNFTVMYNADGDVKVGVYKSDMGHVDGLCGYYDGSPANDRRLPGGGAASTTEQFGDAWAKPGLPSNACQTKVISLDKQKKVWKMCNSITLEPLSRCKSLNLDKWLSICVEKVCECEDTIVNGTRKTFEQCRCQFLEQFVAECLSDNRDVDLAGWRLLHDCPATCPPPLVHSDCLPVEAQCSARPAAGSGPAIPAAVSVSAAPHTCAPGCACPAGLLRRGEDCVPPEACYDCACAILNSPSKFVSFEGDDLPFAGNCTYLASRDRSEDGAHKYEVYVTNGACDDTPTAVCTKIVHVIYDNNIVRIERNPTTNKLLMLLNGEGVYQHPMKKEWMETSVVNGQKLDITLLKSHVQLSVLESNMELSINVPSYVYGNSTEGLCGVCAGDHEHLVMRNGTETLYLDEYGNSWQAEPKTLATLKVPEQEMCGEVIKENECTPSEAEMEICYNLLNKEKFGACHALIEPGEHVERCGRALCGTVAGSGCGALQEYARECRAAGICLNWRGGLCPYTCESPLVYRACVACEETCDNYQDIKLPGKCDQPLQEGCYCPEGKVRVNNTCIEPSKCFPCDANKEHYAGDQWQKDACTTCTCMKPVGENSAHISCTTQSCPAPLCADTEELMSLAVPGQCCKEYSCVPKPRVVAECPTPKKMECAFGQILKQKQDIDGCITFVCECKPLSECEPIPDQTAVDIVDPGMKRVVDQSGCCPKLTLVCDRDSCRGPPECPEFRTLKVSNVSGACCLQYSCELPKDKCLVTLQYEGDASGGEKLKSKPESVLKDLDSTWLDGPCRTCRCQQSAAAPAVSCAVTSCPPAPTPAQLWESRPSPFHCCPTYVQVACLHEEKVYKANEKWNSSIDPCESFQCVASEEGEESVLATRRSVQACTTQCQPGFKYIAADSSKGQCCGKCEPFACVVDGRERNVGDTWMSDDFCAHYTCNELDGTLQVVSTNESCPDVPEEMSSKFVVKTTTVPGKCCKKYEPMACKVGDQIYQEGAVWSTADRCTNYTCTRDGSGDLVHLAVPVEASWRSPDNCTEYSCSGEADSRLMSVTRVTCPDVTHCAPEDLVNDTCCQVCRSKPANLENCVPESVSTSPGVVRLHVKSRGECVNKEPLKRFKECRGSCTSGTVYNNQTGNHDSKCLCCQATHYEPLEVTLTCPDGGSVRHRVATPSQCRCLACGEAGNVFWTNNKPGVKSPLKSPDSTYSDIPDIYKRFDNE